MLKLNLNEKGTVADDKNNLNTSHVKVKPVAIKNYNSYISYLNTSHVKVKPTLPEVTNYNKI